MIITQTPLRMSLAGGGSDIPAFYRKFGGAVVSTAIDKYIYVNVNKKFDNGIRVSYSRTEEVDSVGQVQHPIVRESLNQLGDPGRNRNHFHRRHSIARNRAGLLKLLYGWSAVGSSCISVALRVAGRVGGTSL